jgi:glycosyltransferase involved in cell wall biosynthesis
MYTLGICAPYRRCEATMSAVRLADLGRELSMNVKFLGSGRVQKGVDPHWDTQVRGAKGDYCYHWAQGCTHFAWFSGQKSFYLKSLLVSPEASHWHVPLRNTDNEPLADYVQRADRIVCPSRKSKDDILEAFISETPSLRDKLTWCLWDSGLLAVPSSYSTGDDLTSIYVPAAPHVLDETGGLVLRAVSDILKLFPKSRFTVDCGKSWPKFYRRVIRGMESTYSTRISFSSSLSPLSHVRRMHTHDWTWVPSTRSDTGIVAQRSLSCGTPVIAYDISPYSEFITDEVNGLLIDCDVYSSGSGAPVAGPRFVSVVDTLARAINGEKGLYAKCQKLMVTRERRHSRQFRLFWAKEWGVA